MQSGSKDLDAQVAERVRALGDNTPTMLQRLDTMGRDPRPSAVEGRVTRALEILRKAQSGPLALEGTLGQGGMGVVQVAEQRAVGRRVAVKRLRSELKTQEATLKLLREAWIIGSLEHPNIVPIYDVRLDEEGDGPQIVLKRIEGVSWSDVIRDETALRKRFGADLDLLDHNLHVLMQVARAAHFAHSRGIIHRDIKPSNVMIGAHGEVYLVDWGIAVSLREDPEGRLPQASDCVDVVGTPGYMAPELLQCGVISERTDVYLLGAVLFEILSGEPPHRGNTARDVIASVIRSVPELPDSAPIELAEIAMKAMSVRAEDRYASAEEMRLAIVRYLQQRNAVRLAEEAGRKLEALMDLVSDLEEDGPRSSREGKQQRAHAYGLYGGCCFGYREALEIRPDYPLAKKGIVRAVETMAKLELAWGEPNTARDLLAELTEPPRQLEQRITEAISKNAIEQKRIASLVALGEDRDAQQGARMRRVLVSTLGLSWTVVPLATALVVDPSKGGYPSMVVAPLVVLGGLGVLTTIGRAELKRTAINRGVVAMIAVGLVTQLALAITAPALRLDGVNARTLILLLWAVVIAGGAVMIDRRLWLGAAGMLCAFFLATTFATTIAHVLYAMSGGYFVVSITALTIWKDPPAQRDRGGRS